MFDGFAMADVQTQGATIHLVTGGSGPPLLLLHGYPQTHAMWHRVAPRLAERFTVVAPTFAATAIAAPLPRCPITRAIRSGRWPRTRST